MKTIFAIVKKELFRIFKDRRLLVALFLPGILIYAIYSLLGETLLPSLTGGDHVPSVYIVNLPDELESDLSLLQQSNVLTFEKTDIDEADAVREKISAQESGVDLLVLFPENFRPSAEVSEKQTISFVYNSARTEASVAYQVFSSVLTAKLSLANIAIDDLATEEDMTGMIFSMLAPLFLLMFAATGCMSLVPESIAGEKERGTLGAMLVTPVKRSHVAIGKIVALTIPALLSGIVSFFGVVLSLPKLMSGAEGVSLSTASYGFSDYAMTLAIVISSVVLIVSLLSLVSAFAKSVKEAASMVGPFSILVMLFGFSTMFTGNSAGSPALFTIPLYNSARALYGIFSFAASPLRVLVTVFSNLVWTFLLSLLLAKAFDSEKIVFGK